MTATFVVQQVLPSEVGTSDHAGCLIVGAVSWWIGEGENESTVQKQTKSCFDLEPVVGNDNVHDDDFDTSTL